jgi:hypothetical protein
VVAWPSINHSILSGSRNKKNTMKIGERYERGGCVAGGEWSGRGQNPVHNRPHFTPSGAHNQAPVNSVHTHTCSAYTLKKAGKFGRDRVAYKTNGWVPHLGLIIRAFHHILGSP